MGLVTIFGYLHMRATRTVLAIQGSLPVAFRGGGHTVVRAPAPLCAALSSCRPQTLRN